MTSIFDEIIDRRYTDSLKYAHWQDESDVIPMWVADMDFKIPDSVSDTLHQVLQHGIFGYTDPDESYDRAVCAWYLRNFGWEASPHWNIRTPGVVFSIATAIRALTKEGDNLLIQQPVYYRFTEIVRENNRNLIVNELVLRNDKYHIDFDDFEAKIKANHVKLFILCSPHNPVGRVWTKEELSRMGDICLQYGVYIISDEIHADFVYSGFRHTVFADISQDLAEMTITCVSPTKTFNLPGLQTANTFISGDKLRRLFLKEYSKSGYLLLNTAGLAASKAAYMHGQSWRDDLIAYLESNVAYLRESLGQTNGRVKPIESEGTYLMWLDCRKLSLSDAQLNSFLIHKAKIRMQEGVTFGNNGSGFMRMNIACPKKVLERAVGNLLEAVGDIGK